jgi:hypothetical protein
LPPPLSHPRPRLLSFLPTALRVEAGLMAMSTVLGSATGLMAASAALGSLLRTCPSARLMVALAVAGGRGQKRG